MEHCEGRVIFDILRHVLTACNLASFSLADCALSLLGRRLEVLPGSALAALAELPCPGGAPPTTPTQLAGVLSCTAVRPQLKLLPYVVCASLQ